MSDFYPDGYNNMPSESGKYGPYGGRYVPETLMPALDDVIEAYEEFRDDATFRAEFEHLLKTYIGRPSPVTHAKRLSAHLGGAQTVSYTHLTLPTICSV